MKNALQCKFKAGFTLAEILLAMMVFAIAITTILGLLARSIETADSILVKDEAIGLSSAVDSYMSELPFFSTTEPSAYDMVQDPAKRVIYAYKYRAVPNSDGTLQPYNPGAGSMGQLGSDYIVVSGVRSESTPSLLDEDIAAREGRLFRVQFEVSDANPFTGTLPPDPNIVNGSTGLPAYDSAVLVIFAEFYQVPDSGIAPTGDPVFSFNFAVRR